VVLYWLTSNIWTMGQQFYVIRRMPAPGSPAEEKFKRRQEHKGGRGAAPAAAAGPTVVVADPSPVSPTRQQPKRTTRSQRKSKK
jgi:YidC/Oxa1 family membrane protein insertase